MNGHETPKETFVQTALCAMAVLSFFAVLDCSKKSESANESNAVASAPERFRPTAAPHDPCALLTLAEIDSTLGGEFAPRPIARPPNDSTIACPFSGSEGRHLVISTRLFQADDWKQSMDTTHGVPTSGIGESAFFVNVGERRPLWANNGKSVVIVTYLGLGLDQEKIEAGEKAVATKALSRL